MAQPRRFHHYGTIEEVDPIRPMTAEQAAALKRLVSVDVSKITCKQFVLHEIARPRLVATWLSGYYAGRRELTTVNIQAFEKNIKGIERFCTKVDN